MSMKRYVLDGSTILSLSDFYDKITRLLALPGHFGRNLDALADSLLTDVKGPLEIVWESSSASQAAMKQDYAKIAALLKNVARERDDFKVTFR